MLVRRDKRESVEKLCATMLILLISGCGGSFFVSNSTIVSITISPSSPTVQVGGTEQFVATGTRADGATEDVSTGAAWSSSQPGVATIDSAGLATAISVGTTTIKAKYQRGEAETFLTVASGTLNSISISPTNATISVSSAQQYTATGTYSDGTKRNITTSVTWSSSNSAVATISSTGVATGLASGGTTIRATSGSITASATLTVN